MTLRWSYGAAGSLILSLFGTACDPFNEAPPEQMTVVQDEPRRVPVRFEPPQLDLGVVQAGKIASGIVRLVNVSGQPARVLEAKSSCGCTVADVSREAFGPGESIEVRVTMHLTGANAKKTTKAVHFVVEGVDEPLTLSVTGQPIEFVTYEPRRIQGGVAETQVITLSSIDRVPFRVTAVDPPLDPSGQRGEPSDVHRLVIPAAAVAGVARSRRLTIFLDHPMVNVLQVPIQLARKVGAATIEEPATDEANASPNPTQASTLLNEIQVIPRVINIGTIAAGETFDTSFLLKDMQLDSANGATQVQLVAESDFVAGTVIESRGTPRGTIVRARFTILQHLDDLDFRVEVQAPGNHGFISVHASASNITD